MEEHQSGHKMAGKEDQKSPVSDDRRHSQLRATYGALAAKLMRTFTMQLDALGRLRGQATKQVVQVEHVNVQAGGQAVVGAVKVGGDESGS